MPLLFTWSEFWQQVVSGLASGGIYASLALAIVIVYRSTRVINFAQGEMAMFTTFIAWTLLHHGFSYWPAFVLTLLIAFAGGVALERVVIRPVEHAPLITVVIVTIGLFVVLNGLAAMDLGQRRQELPEPLLDPPRARRRRRVLDPGPRDHRRLRRARRCSGSSSASRSSGWRCARRR